MLAARYSLRLSWYRVGLGKKANTGCLLLVLSDEASLREVSDYVRKQTLAARYSLCLPWYHVGLGKKGNAGPAWGDMGALVKALQLRQRVQGKTRL
jgi:hypothetical protein